jgi:colanic acid/amylovoran biosynthesis glycosyltransferase|tara:strand:- start:252 stop:1469 length:1218 start_codon:yes stop_codon:yes gene_type:complete
LPKLAFFYATFPRPTETFVRRELRAINQLDLSPRIYSIWGGAKHWEGIQVYRFSCWKLYSVLFWLPYWAWRKPSAFCDVLKTLWHRPCPNIQNWNETFLGLGFALVEARRVESEGFEALHAVWATMPATAAYALSRLIDVPFSMGAHAYDLFRRGGDWMLPEKLNHASMIRTSSKSSSRRLYAMGMNKEKVQVIRRGLCHWPKRSSFELIKPLHLELISVGRLVEKKGYFLLLRILFELMKRGKCDFRMNIVGGGPLANKLDAEIHRYGLVEKVNLLGSKSEEEVRDLFLRADAKLFTGIIGSNGDRDGIPNVIPEAMSAGCLILASHHAGASEAFTDGSSGYSLNPVNFHEWVEILESFANYPTSFRKIRKNAQLHARERFDVRNTARLLVSNFEEMFIENDSA